ncbi:MAG: hypothetical protein KatS3mg102_0912 [Planctomycetota bacterium]|nr:MAG: hypothetical protein KatS3mg102_0912 [Planctomycetota bacterium]
MRVVPWQHRAASEVERAAVVATPRAPRSPTSSPPSG